MIQFFSAVVKKLAGLDELNLQKEVDRKLDEVKVQLGQMQCFLKDAESKKKRGDERIKGLVRDVRSSVYETEDAIDTFLVVDNHRMLGLKLNRPRVGLKLNRPRAYRILVEKLREIPAILVRISEAYEKNLSGDGDHSQSLLQTQPNYFKRRVVPDIDNDEVVGFEAENREIINLLLHPSDQSRCVVSIVGPGGAGKTTLAHKLYNYSTVRNNFDSCLWISVSQDFNLLDVLKKLHQQLTNETEWLRVLGVLREILLEDEIVFLLGKVKELLKEKKYLIVFDDVWTEDSFTQLETGLIDVRNGSRVLMTTRNLNVAKHADSRGVCLLRFLNKEESLRLLLEKALGSSDPSAKCPDELLDLATKLVKRCDGLPLALTLLGGLLSTKPRAHQEWSRVLERLDWHVVGGGECMKILATSYDDLPYLLNSCFRYLACFPENYEIQAKLLMKMWIAEGLIEYKNERELEDNAEDYLQELVQRCLVQVVERSPDGTIVSIRVHNILHQVALGEATEKDSLLIWKEENAEGDVSMTRRVAVHQRTDESSSINQSKDLRNIKMSRLRTFINFELGCSVIGIVSPLLRVLELSNTSIRDLPINLKNMIHLRYLGLRGTGVTVIPPWIGNLQNLQIFNISDTDIRELPKSFWNITCLRHVQSSFSFMVGPPSTANLVNLRSLGCFLVPQSWKKSFPYLPRVGELQLYCDDENDGMLIHNLLSKLNHLRSVSIYNFYPPSGIFDFSTSPSFQNIHTMHFSANKPTDPPIVHIGEMPPKLTMLKLQFFRLNDDSMTKLQKLRSLKCLELDHIRMEVDTIVCTNRGFPGLQSLELYHVLKMKEWKVEHGALPVLKYLLIKSCKDLRALPELQCVPTLQQLEIDRELQSKIKNKSGKEWDKVKYIPTIIGPNH